MPIHLIIGEDDFLVASAAESIIAGALNASERAFGLEVLDGRADKADDVTTQVGRFLEALQTISFFTGKRVVWFRELTFLHDARIGKSAAVKAAVERLLAGIEDSVQEGTTVILSAASVPKTSALYKRIAKSGTVQDFALPDKAWEADRERKARLQEVVRRAGLTLEADAMDVLAARMAGNVRQMVGEVEKLSVYAGRQRVTADDVLQVCSQSAEALAWDLTDAVSEGDAARCLVVLRQLKFQKESAMGLLVMLQRRLRDLVVLRECLDGQWLAVIERGRRTECEWRPNATAEASLARLEKDPRAMNPYMLGRLARLAKARSTRFWQRAYERMVAAHERLVSASLPEYLVLEQAVLGALPLPTHR